MRSAHKRMSHGKRERLRSDKNEPASVEAIVSMYEQLPEKGKKEVLNRLLAREGRPKCEGSPSYFLSLNSPKSSS